MCTPRTISSASHASRNFALLGGYAKDAAALTQPIRTPENQPSARARVVAGSLLQAGARILGLFCGLATMAFLTRHLQLGDYGRYALAVVLVNWLSGSLSLLMGGALVRLVAGSADGIRYAAAMLRLMGLAGCAAGAVVSICAEWIALALGSPQIEELLRILALDIPIAAVSSVYLGILTARGQNGKNATAIFSGWVFQFLGVVLLVGNGWAAQGAVWAVVAANFVELILLAAMCGGLPFGGARVGFSELWKKSRLMAGAQILLRISQTMDLVAVKFFLGSPQAAGLYAGAQNIGFAAMLVFMPSSSIVLQSVSASRLRENHAEASHVAISFLRAAFIYGGALVAMAVFSQDIAVFLLGPNFADSAPLLAWLLVAVAFRISAGAGRTLIAAAGEKPSIMLPLAIVVGLGLAAYAIVIPRFGAVGGAAAAVGMAFCTAVVSLRDGLRLMKIGLPGGTLLRVATASASTALFGLFLKRAEWHVLADLTLATLFYGMALILIREWVPTRAHLEKAKAALRSKFFN